ncbi:hypothetical protein K503DRAFT_364265 [Rhizopogon vinicolor AM-OR11-026]|uniref:Heterokaryon incompatibility domain-containing protein n=1 Tax=Rhizopogon vinicolor AM-OR11-026 TaxID=1314800 RepID=A0A1B7MSE5_9AGAM|nr:hypothetical protein K503DRAFT_364265 [Rhizopogon vinicolor AM-OR11-026]
MQMGSSLAGMETRANLLPKPSQDIQVGSTRWIFLPMEQCWRPAHGTTRPSCGAPTLGRCKEIQSIAVKKSTAFGLLPLVNSLQLRQTMVSKYGTHGHGNASCVAKFKAAIYLSLAWTPDGRRLLSAGSTSDPTVREWDTLTWQQVGDPWSGHTNEMNAIAVNSTGTLVASASYDNDVRIWQLSDRRTIAIFKHSNPVYCVAFSMDGKHVISGGVDTKILEWEVSEDASLEDAPNEQASEDTVPETAPEDQVTDKIISMNTSVRNAYIIGDLPTAEELLTQEININAHNYNSYANRSLVMARKGDWDNALDDALRSVSIQPSLTGYVSQGIALCGKKLFPDAMKAFDLAFMFTDGDLKTVYLLLLVKAIALFNANQQQEAMLRIHQLVVACPNQDILACRVVQAYLRVQQGINAFDDARYNEAVDHFTAAINSGAFSSDQAIHLKYDIFVVLFGWDLASLWQTANQKRCYALLRTGRRAEALEEYRYMDMSDAAKTDSYRDWTIAFKMECSERYATDGDAALAEKDYDKSIELYSVAIELDSVDDTLFANRCAAKLEKLLWEDALIDAQKLNHAALHGVQRYDEAIAAFEIMLSKLNDTPDTQIRKLIQQYATSSEAGNAIQEAINVQLENTPHRLFNTITGQLSDRGAQISVFKTSPEYKELLSSTMKHGDLRMERIKQAVEMYFRCVMLSHRWEENEPLLHNIQDKNVYELHALSGIAKSQSFCKTARDAGYRWAWIDTCCIDQTNNVEVQQSVNSMFLWYRHAALTIIYLSDVPRSSKSGALAMSIWNKRGWTVQEFLAPKVVLFYQHDWTLYLDDRSPNHKDCPAIMRELGDATGIDAQALGAFYPGMRGARDKLQWVSRRVTTLQEDVAYSLFGIFDVHLAVIYGEKKHNALGRLLQEVVAQSGDITCLDWVGKSSEFNSCLPADIASYGAPPSTSPSLSDDEMQALIFSLQNDRTVELALKLYHKLSDLSAPRFAARRLHLPCIVFPVTEFRWRRGQDQQPHSTFAVKADGLDDLLITTEDKIQPSRTRPALQSFLLVRPWDRSLLERPDFADFHDVYRHSSHLFRIKKRVLAYHFPQRRRIATRKDAIDGRTEVNHR